MAYVWQVVGALLVGSLGLLGVFLGILLVNLRTFPRLTATGCTKWREAPTSSCADRLRRRVHDQRPPTHSWRHSDLWARLEATLRRSRSAHDEIGASPFEREKEPLVSILVPARNEEACIEACVRSLVGQKYGRLEVLVLDDQSSDATAAIVQRLIDELPDAQSARLRLLRGGELPRGWIGKNFACHQLAQQARGDYLLFTDADTIHAPEMTGAVLDAMRRQGVQLLTGQPEQILGSAGERLIVPLLNFTILTLLPIPLIARRPEPSLATGNGQLLCFQRTAYEAIGGHEAVKDRILEDVLLARRIKAARYRMLFVDAFELVQCRMYHSWREVWAGFSKNLFAFYNYSFLFASFALLLNVLLFVLPTLLLIAALFLPLPTSIVLYSLGAYLLAVTMRVLLTLRFTRVQRTVLVLVNFSWSRVATPTRDCRDAGPTEVHQNSMLMLLYSLLHPVSIVLECAILVNAIRWHYRKAGIQWKGRQYT